MGNESEAARKGHDRGDREQQAATIENDAHCRRRAPEQEQEQLRILKHAVFPRLRNSPKTGRGGTVPFTLFEDSAEMYPQPDHKASHHSGPCNVGRIEYPAVHRRPTASLACFPRPRCGAVPSM